MLVACKFEGNFKTYVYDSGPFDLRTGDTVVVLPYGKQTLCKVVDTNISTAYTGEVQSIVGVVTFHNDLLPNQIKPKSYPTRMYVALAVASTFAIQYILREYGVYFEQVLGNLKDTQ